MREGVEMPDAAGGRGAMTRPRLLLPPVLALALLLGLGLRVWGIGWGLPDGVEPDEPKMVEHALAFGLGDFNPHYYHYPHLPMYLLFGCYGVLYLCLLATGRIHDVSGFKAIFLTDPSLFYEVGRGVTVLFALASLLLVWELGRRSYGSSIIGALAALALAVLPVDVVYGHYVRSDVPVTCFMLLALNHIVRIGDEKGLRAHWLAGLGLGLAAATKYTGLVLLAPLLVAQGLAFPRMRLRAALASLGAALAAGFLAFAVTSPYSVVNWRDTLDGVRMVYEIKYAGQFGIARGSSWTTYLRASFLSGPLPLLCLAGVVYALVRRRRADLILLSLVVPYLLMVGPSQSQSAKYLVPLGPILALLACRLAVDLWERSLRHAAWRTAVAVLFAASLGASLSSTVSAVRDLRREDTRNAARAWIEGNLPAGSTVALEWGGETVRLRESDEGISEKMARYCVGKGDPYDMSPEQLCEALKALKRVESDRPAYRTVTLGSRIGKGNRLSTENMDLARLASLGTGYIVTSNASVERDRDLLRKAYPAWAEFYDSLDLKAELLQRFEERPGGLRGPTVSIYRAPAPGVTPEERSASRLR